MLGKDSHTEKYPCLLFIYLFIVVISVYVHILYMHAHMHACVCMHRLSEVDLGIFLSCSPSFFLKDKISD